MNDADSPNPTTTATTTTTTPPPIGSRAEFVAALQWGFAQAIAGGARRIVCIDADFAEGPLDAPALHAALTGWLRQPQRRLVLLAADFAELPRRQPRFVAWRALWSHAIEAWSPAEGERVDLPTLLLDDRAVSVQLHDAVHWRGRAELDARSVQRWRDPLDALLQRSQPAFPVNSLGL